MKKVRLDQLVFDRGLTESRERAKTTIMSGVVFVNGQREKPRKGAGGMPQSLNASAITFSVTVFPVPVAPAIIP